MTQINDFFKMIAKLGYDWHTDIDEEYGNGDGTLIKAEFRRYINAEWSGTRSNMNDLVDNFWSKMDTDHDAGNFTKDGVKFHDLNALDETEIGKFNTYNENYFDFYTKIDEYVDANTQTIDGVDIDTLKSELKNMLYDKMMPYIDDEEFETQLKNEFSKANTQAVAKVIANNLKTSAQAEVSEALSGNTYGYNLANDNILADIIDNYINNIKAVEDWSNMAKETFANVKSDLENIINAYLQTAGINDWLTVDTTIPGAQLARQRAMGDRQNDRHLWFSNNSGGGVIDGGIDGDVNIGGGGGSSIGGSNNGNSGGGDSSIGGSNNGNSGEFIIPGEPELPLEDPSIDNGDDDNDNDNKQEITTILSLSFDQKAANDRLDDYGYTTSGELNPLQKVAVKYELTKALKDNKEQILAGITIETAKNTAWNSIMTGLDSFINGLTKADLENGITIKINGTENTEFNPNKYIDQDAVNAELVNYYAAEYLNENLKKFEEELVNGITDANATYNVYDSTKGTIKLPKDVAGKFIAELEEVGRQYIEYAIENTSTEKDLLKGLEATLKKVLTVWIKGANPNINQVPLGDKPIVTLANKAGIEIGTDHKLYNLMDELKLEMMPKLLDSVKTFNEEDVSKLNTTAYQTKNFNFGIKDGDIFFEDTYAKQIFENVVNKLNKLDSFGVFSKSELQNLTRTAWIMSCELCSKDDVNINEFLKQLMNNIYNILKVVSEDFEMLEVFLRAPAYGGNSPVLTNEDGTKVKHYYTDTTYGNDSGVTYEDYDDDYAVQTIRLTGKYGFDEKDNKDYQDTVGELFSNIYRRYGAYVDITNLKQIFYEAQKLALETMNSNTDDCPYGTSRGSGQVDNYTSTSATWGQNDRTDDEHDTKMGDLIQLILYKFDKLIYKYLVQ